MEPDATINSPVTDANRNRNDDPPDLTGGSEVRQVLTHGGPLAAGMVMHALFNLVDFWVCAQLGPDGINAVGIVDVIMLVPSLVANGICTGSIAVIARNYGLKRFNRGASAAWHAVALMMVLGVITGVVGWLLGDWMLLTFLREGTREMEWAQTYLLISAWGSVTMFLILQLTSILRATGESFWPMIIFFMSTALNVAGDFLLVFGYEPLGIPRMNVAGAAVASAIARSIGIGVALLMLFRGRQKDRVSLRGLKFSLTEIWLLVRLGLPSAAQLVARVVAVYMLAAIVDTVDSGARSAYIICLRLDMLAIFCCLGWGAGASTLVGQNLGAGQPDRAARAGWYSAGMAAVVMLAVTACFIAFTGPLVGFFSEKSVELEQNGQVTELATKAKQIGTQYMLRVAPTYAFLAISIILALSLNGAGSTKTPLLFDSVIMLGGLIPAAHLLMQRGSNLNDLWLLVAGANVVLAVPYVIWFAIGKWRFKELR